MHNGVDSIASAAKRRRPCQRLVQAALALLLAGATLAAAAIDNPDAPDRVAAFAARAAPLEAALAETSGGSAASQAGQAYAVFLDTELNTAYHALLARLQPPARQALVVSQRQWLRFRDAEQGFIGQQWTPERQGSSASLSVAGYRNALIHQRVVQLLQYSAEFR